MSSGDPPPQGAQDSRIQAALAALTMGGEEEGGRKTKYDFWETQPVAQFGERPGASDVSVVVTGRRLTCARA
jgi:hypothetical protein